MTTLILYNTTYILPFERVKRSNLESPTLVGVQFYAALTFRAEHCAYIIQNHYIIMESLIKKMFPFDSGFLSFTTYLAIMNLNPLLVIAYKFYTQEVYSQPI